MPYIKETDRQKYTNTLAYTRNVGIKTKGELEYLIFSLMQIYMEDKEKRYSILHDVVYAAIHCGDEFRRRFLDKREDEARRTNGDVG